MKKKKTTTKQTNEYKYVSNPGSADIDAYRTQINQQRDTQDPNIQFQYNNQRQNDYTFFHCGKESVREV